MSEILWTLYGLALFDVMCRRLADLTPEDVES